MKYTICAFAGRRVEITESTTTPGAVKLSVLGADRQPVAVVTLEALAADVMSSALKVVAEAVEKSMEVAQ